MEKASPAPLSLPSDSTSPAVHTLRIGMVGMGMIFDETYRPFFENVHRQGLFDRRFGVCNVELAARE